ncbi:MAG: DUF378 domain-containing protein [Sphingomonadaceae bacterium]
MRFNTSEWISGGLAIVGALNWGIVGLFGFNLVHTLFGWSKPVERLIYTTVGLAGAFFAFRALQSQGMPVVPPQVREQVQERRPVGIV